MGSTTPLAAPRIPGFTPATSGLHRFAGQLNGLFDALSSNLVENPLPLFILGAAIIAAHLLIVIFQPSHAAGFVSICTAAASVMQVPLLLIHVRRSRGTVALRWLFFAITFSLITISYTRAAVTSFSAFDSPTLRVVLTLLLTYFALFALTLPSQEMRTDERILDASIAMAFCALRFLFLSIVVPPNSPHAIERMTVDSGIQTVVALLACLAARSADRIFFRAATFTAVAMLFSMILTNDVGVTILHQPAGSLSLIDTIARVACALYFYYALFKQDQKVEAEPYREALGSIVPFVLTALVVFLSAILLPTHPYLGYSGVTFGIGAFLLRIAFMSRQNKQAVVIDESLLREIASEVVKGDLLSFADHSNLESALAAARHSVGPQSPVSLILFWMNGISTLPGSRPDQKSQATATIAQAISHWQTPTGTVCNMGDGMFVMLLPETPLRVAMPLAEQICRSLESIQLDGVDDSAAVAGVATCTEPSKLVSLLQNSSVALERAQQKRASRVRSMQILGEAAFDA